MPEGGREGPFHPDNFLENSQALSEPENRQMTISANRPMPVAHEAAGAHGPAVHRRPPATQRNPGGQASEQIQEYE